jgi:hypothetical protein
MAEDRSGRAIQQAAQWAPLKFLLFIFPFSLFQVLWPNHARVVSSLGLALGIVCAQISPPRQSIRSILFWATIYAIIGAALPSLNLWR